MTAFGGAYTVDALTTFLDVLFIAIIALTIAFAPDYLVARGLPVAEFIVVLLFAMTGAMLLSASTDLLLLFLGLELMVLPGYLLAAYHKTDAYSTEGAIKYFLLGSFSSAIFLFGLAFIWGMTGTTQGRRRVRRAQRHRRRGRAARARAGDGARVPDHRRRLQDRGRPVPLLDAGRVPGLADADHRLPLGRPEDRRVRADPAALRRGDLAAPRLVAAGRHGPGRADDDPRQPRGADAGQRQADARLQLDRAHRLHARRAGRLRRRPDPGPRGPALLLGGLRGDEPGRVRRSSPRSRSGRASPRSSTRSPGWAARSRSSRSC